MILAKETLPQTCSSLYTGTQLLLFKPIQSLYINLHIIRDSYSHPVSSYESASYWIPSRSQFQTSFNARIITVLTNETISWRPTLLLHVGGLPYFISLLLSFLFFSLAVSRFLSFFIVFFSFLYSFLVFLSFFSFL